MKHHQIRGLLALCLLGAVDTSAAVRFVNVNSAHPAPPYLTWVTAATNIQDAVDAATAGDQIRVTNGVYQVGGSIVTGDVVPNRVAVTKAVTVESVNGPEVTSIVGDHTAGTPTGPGAIRCVYLTNGATLSGFTLTNGATPTSGGAVRCESASAVVSNCVLAGNLAGGSGGGAYRGTLDNCRLTGNSASKGGGAHASILNNCTLDGNSAIYGGGVSGDALGRTTLTNCTLTGNSALYGGGAYTIATGRSSSDCTLNHCTLTGNSATGMINWITLDQGGGGAHNCRLYNCIVYYNNGDGIGNGNVYKGSTTHCCTTPQLLNDASSITAAPLFLNTNDWSNLRLRSNSPCINAGNNTYVGINVDFDGRPRVISGTVDIGAYEFQGPFNDYLQQFGLPTDGSADFTDPDGDGLNNWLESLAGTVPTNAASLVRLLGVTPGISGMTVSWQSVSNRVYFLEHATNLDAQTPFSPVASNIDGREVVTSFTDTNAVGPGPFFYRVGVQ